MNKDTVEQKNITLPSWVGGKEDWPFPLGTDGEVADFVISATSPSRSFLLAASLALRLDCFDFNSWISFHASDILAFSVETASVHVYGLVFFSWAQPY